MKFDWKHILLFIILGGLGAWFIIDHVSQSRKHKSIVKQKSDSVCYWHTMYQTCISLHSIVIQGKDSISDTAGHHPKPTHSYWRGTPMDSIHRDSTGKVDSSSVECYNTYNDSIEWKENKTKLVYHAEVFNCRLSSFRVDKFVYPKDTAKFVMDTCIAKKPEVQEVEKSHLFVIFGTSYNWSSFNSVNGGVNWTIKGKFQIEPKLVYDATGKVSKWPYPELNMGFRVK